MVKDTEMKTLFWPKILWLFFFYLCLGKTCSWTPFWWAGTEKNAPSQIKIWCEFKWRPQRELLRQFDDSMKAIGQFLDVANRNKFHSYLSLELFYKIQPFIYLYLPPLLAYEHLMLSILFTAINARKALNSSYLHHTQCAKQRRNSYM